jgi:hypothetical protein
MAHTLYEHLQRLHSSDSDTEAQNFQGDAFGFPKDYATDTFGQDMDMPAEHPPADVEDDEPLQSDESEEEEEDTIELEHSWELPREGAPAEGIEEEVDDNNSQEEFQENLDIGAHRVAECVVIDEGHGVKPAVVLCYTDKYPSSAAGEILACGEIGDKSYCAAVSGQDKSPCVTIFPFDFTFSLSLIT